MAVRATCSVCNSVVTFGAVPDSGRVVCPRCGDRFAATDAVETDDAVTPVARPAKAGFPAAVAASVAVALAGLAVGLYLVFATPPKPAPAPPRPPGTVPPAALAGLTLLPPKANIVFAVQPGPLVAFAELVGADPMELLTRAGVPTEAVNVITKFGVPLADIDHVAGGVTLADDSVFPGFALVLKLRMPHPDEAAFLANLKAEKKPKAGRPTYAVTAGLPLTMTVIDDRTYLFGLLDGDFAAADKPSAVPLREVLAARLSPASFAWAATAAEKWGDKAVVKAFTKSAKDAAFKTLAAKIGRGRQVVVGLSLEPVPQLRVAVKVADATDAGGVRDHFTAAFPGPDAVVAGVAEWATLEAPFDPAKGSDAWKKLLPEWK